jgi:hypothetical protein
VTVGVISSLRLLRLFPPTLAHALSIFLPLPLLSPLSCQAIRRKLVSEASPFPGAKSNAWP